MREKKSNYHTIFFASSYEMGYKMYGIIDVDVVGLFLEEPLP
jgi:hypothetical protein